MKFGRSTRGTTSTHTNDIPRLKKIKIFSDILKRCVLNYSLADCRRHIEEKNGNQIKA